MLIWKKETNPGISKSKHQASVVHGFLEFGRFSAAIMKGVYGLNLNSAYRFVMSPADLHVCLDITFQSQTSSIQTKMRLYNKDFFRENREKPYIAHFMWQLQGFFKEKSK